MLEALAKALVESFEGYVAEPHLELSVGEYVRFYRPSGEVVVIKGPRSVSLNPDTYFIDDNSRPVRHPASHWRLTAGYERPFADLRLDENQLRLQFFDPANQSWAGTSRHDLSDPNSIETILRRMNVHLVVLGRPVSELYDD